jgi:hypothetical protein
MVALRSRLPLERVPDVIAGAVQLIVDDLRKMARK